MSEELDPGLIHRRPDGVRCASRSSSRCCAAASPPSRNSRPHRYPRPGPSPPRCSDRWPRRGRASVDAPGRRDRGRDVRRLAVRRGGASARRRWRSPATSIAGDRHDARTTWARTCGRGAGRTARGWPTRRPRAHPRDGRTSIRDLGEAHPARTRLSSNELRVANMEPSWRRPRRRRRRVVMIDMESDDYVDRRSRSSATCASHVSAVGVALQSYLRRRRARRGLACLPGSRHPAGQGCVPRAARRSRTRATARGGRQLCPPVRDPARARRTPCTWPRTTRADRRAPRRFVDAASDLAGRGWSSRCCTVSAATCRRRSPRRAYPVRVYVPYGTEWYPYLTRRLAERPANMWFFLSNLVRSER